jgi:hypothetical protein
MITLSTSQLVFLFGGMACAIALGLGLFVLWVITTLDTSPIEGLDNDAKWLDNHLTQGE